MRPGSTIVQDDSLGATIAQANPYDIHSTQLWTKSGLLFLPYNELANAIYRHRGYYDEPIRIQR